MNLQQQYFNRLNSLLEGIQVIDYNWRYVYLNDIMDVQSKMPKEELLGHTMMEKYPGIENTKLFEILKLCMSDRQTRRTENEFIYSDKSVKWFDLCIQPAKEGICILSLDITQHKKIEDKISKSKSLYSFLSHINKSIVHLTNQEALFKSACNTAFEIGKFKMAWIGLFDADHNTVNLVEQCGLAVDISYYKNAAILVGSPQRQVLKTGTYFSCPNVENLPHTGLNEYAQNHGIRSFIILPLQKCGKIIGTFNLYSDRVNFVGNEEILLLEEVVADISFALNNFEKEKLHRETELILLENEKRFRALIEKSSDMKTLATAEGKLLYGSPSITTVLGYEPDTMINTSIFKLIHPDDVEAFAEKRKKLLQLTGASSFFEIRMRHLDGHWLWCEGTSTNLLEESGVHAVVSNFRDVTSKKEIEQQAKFDRDNMYALINNTKDLMWSIDKNLKLITSNDAFNEIFTKIYGKPLSKGNNILHKNLSLKNHDLLKTFYKRALAGETFSETVQLNAGMINWAIISFQPIINNNEIIGTACHSIDTTQIVETSLALEKQNKELIKTNFELDRFVYSVSHDLRSPLTSILGLLSFIEDESKEPETLQHAAMIHNAINRLDGFIKDILIYSRNNRTDVESEIIPLQDTITDIISILRHIKNADDIDFEVNINQQQPFYSDRRGFNTIIENIVSNAIKFHKSKMPGKYIRISGHSDGKTLELILEDNGIGIPEIHLDKIFNMFFRAEGAVDGAGIGLYIVKEIVTKLNGTISVRSALGKGTAFAISLKNMRP